MNVILLLFTFLRVIGGIVIVCLYYNNSKKLKNDLYVAENLPENITNFSMIVLLGMIISGISFWNLIGTIIISFGMFLIYRETFKFTIQGDFLTLTKSLTHPKFIPQSSEIFSEKTEFTGMEDISQPALESSVVKAEIKSELAKQPEIMIKEEISQPFTESMVPKVEFKPEFNIKPETIIKEDIPKQFFETSIAKAETKPEIVIQPKSISEVEINQKKILEKPIRSNFAQVEAKPLVLKKCPFCGKKREDLNVPFCYACGYKF